MPAQPFSQFSPPLNCGYSIPQRFLAITVSEILPARKNGRIDENLKNRKCS
jgi:hypothetical protein